MEFKKIVSLFFSNKLLFLRGFLRHFPYLVSDKQYVKIQYKASLGVYPDLKNPKTFTEKLQWLKLYYHNPLYTNLVDKILVKEYVKNKIGEDYIIPTLFIYENADEINFENLPNQFVLKCNHTGGGNVLICKNKYSFDLHSAKIKLNKQLRFNNFLFTREWPYKNIKRKILCEQYMEDETGELRDYKFYCFDGLPKLLLVASNRYSTHNFSYYDIDFNPLNIESKEGSKSIIELKQPDNYSKMLEIAKILSEGFPHVRVDLYNIKGQIYFGELTFYDSSGFDDMNSDEWNRKLGDMIKLPEKRL